MRLPTDAEVNATLNAIELHNQPSPLPTKMEIVNEARLLPRQQPLTSMEWSFYERERLRAFMGQATRYRRQSLLGRLLGWLR